MRTETMTENMAMEYRPTLIQRFWRWAGFRYHLGEEPEGADKLSGWMMTESHFQFGFADRLRLLVSGHLHIRLAQHTPKQVELSKNRLDWEIEPPGSGKKEKGLLQ